MVDYDSVGPSLQLFRARFLNFSSSWQSCDFEVREMLISPESTGFHLRAACFYKLVIVIAGRLHQAMHAGRDNCHPPCRAILFYFLQHFLSIYCCFSCCFCIFIVKMKAVNAVMLLTVCAVIWLRLILAFDRLLFIGGLVYPITHIFQRVFTLAT